MFSKVIKKAMAGLAAMAVFVAGMPMVQVYAKDSFLHSSDPLVTKYATFVVNSRFSYVEGEYAENVSISDSITRNTNYNIANLKCAGVRMETKNFSTYARQIYEGACYVGFTYQAALNAGNAYSWCQAIVECDGYGDVTEETTVRNYK